MNAVTPTGTQQPVSLNGQNEPISGPGPANNVVDPGFDLSAGGTVVLEGSTATIHSPSLERPVVIETGFAVPEAVVIDLSIIYLTMQSIMDSTVESIESKNSNRKQTFEEYFAKLNEQAEKSSDKCGGGQLWMKLFQAITIVASVAMIVGTMGTAAPIAVALAAFALTLEAVDMVVEAATGKGLFTRMAEGMVNAGFFNFLPEEYRELVATIIIMVIILVMSVSGSIFGAADNVAEASAKTVDDVVEAGVKTGAKTGDDAIDSATRSQYITKAIDDPSGAWVDDMAADLVKQGFSPEEASKLAADFHKKSGSIIGKTDDAGDAASTGAKVASKTDTAADAATVTHGTKTYDRKTIEKLNELMSELVQLTSKSKNGGKASGVAGKGADAGKAGKAAEATEATTEFKGITGFVERLLGKEGVIGLTKAGAFMEILGTVGMASVGIQQGIKSIELGKLEKEVVTLETELQVLEEELGIDFDFFAYYTEVQAKVAQTMGEVNTAQGGALMKLI